MVNAAVDAIRARATTDSARALERLRAVGVEPRHLADLVRDRARPTINFHPDRRDRSGRTVVDGLLADGRYRSQYETGISNGGRFAAPGGLRATWEADLFGQPPAAIADRPVYGALDLTRDQHGGSPRFGSSFLVLHERTLERATFCVGDSHAGPADVGTFDVLAPVLAGIAELDGGERAPSTAALVDLIAQGTAHPARSLDDSVEMQVHGGVRLEPDVAEVHLDPSFRHTEVAAAVAAISARYDVHVVWHAGSELAATDVPPDFRGEEIAALAHRTARAGGTIDAATIGRALDDLPYVPAGPEGDHEGSPLQRYKKLWHCVLRFGVDATAQVADHDDESD